MAAIRCEAKFQWKNECVLKGREGGTGKWERKTTQLFNVSFKDRQGQGMDRECPLFNNNINAPSFKHHRVHIPLHWCRPRCCEWKTHLFPQVHKVTGHLFPPPIPKYCELPYLNKRTQPQPPKKKKNELCQRAKTWNGKNKRKQQRFMRGVKEKHKFFPGSNHCSPV